MTSLEGLPFVKEEPLADLKPDEEVFFSPIASRVRRDFGSVIRRRGVSKPTATRELKRLLTLKETSVDSYSGRISPDFLPSYVDIPTPGGKRRYYVGLTASEERAKDFRFQVDCRAAYDGTRMSSCAFRTNRNACHKAEAFLAAVYPSNLENSRSN